MYLISENLDNETRGSAWTPGRFERKPAEALLLGSHVDLCNQGRGTPQNADSESLTDAVGRVIAYSRSGRVSERRKRERFPYPFPVQLTPVTSTLEPIIAQSFVVIGKFLSTEGFDFYSLQPLPWRRAIASFELGCNERIGILLDLRSCHFSRHGWYVNGGRFVGAMDAPRIELPEPGMVWD